VLVNGVSIQLFFLQPTSLHLKFTTSYLSCSHDGFFPSRLSLWLKAESLLLPAVRSRIARRGWAGSAIASQKSFINAPARNRALCTVFSTHAVELIGGREFWTDGRLHWHPGVKRTDFHGNRQTAHRAAEWRLCAVGTRAGNLSGGLNNNGQFSVKNRHCGAVEKVSSRTK
jgi:hypothetical protein